MHTLKILLQLSAALTLSAAGTVGLASAAERAAAGECGEFKYYQNGQCVDARQKPGKDWTAGALK